MKPRLLFLGHNLPHPPDVGLAVRSNHLLRAFARMFDVTALCFHRRATRAAASTIADSVAALTDLARVEAFPIPQEQSNSRKVWDHLRSLAQGVAYTRLTYASDAYEQRLLDVLRSTGFALAYVDSIDLSRYLPHLGGLPVIIGHQNAESDLLRRRARVQRPLWVRPYLDLQARLLAREEESWCPRVALNITCSDEDQAILSRLAPRARFAVVPNGADVDYYRPEAGRENGIVFVGGTTWFPNRDALNYFVRKIVPLLRNSGVGDQVTWVGRATAEERRALGAIPGLTFTGHVEDVRPYVRDAACYVVPLRVGGGTRLKIVEAWAMGKAVVTSPVGCQGLRATDGHNVLVRESPADFAAAVRDVLRDADLRHFLGERARATAVKYYSWERIGKHLVAQCRGLLGPRLPRGEVSG